MVKTVRGTSDILPSDVGTWQALELVSRNLLEAYDYREIRTPIFEQAGLFQKSVGESTDIVSKEMYVFSDKKGRELALRPEGTASIVRSFVEHNMYTQPFPVKLYYIGPFFRYERPQSGRTRQFHQIGAEAIGIEDVRLDAEIIDIAIQIPSKMGIKNLKVMLNSIGCGECRSKYVKHLLAHLENRIKNLCMDCKRRYSTNPLRILDCKKPECIQHVKEGPTITENLCAKCRNKLETVEKHINCLGIDYQIQPYLVRGLDYYTGVIFEIIHSQLGAQNVVAAGGRYDNLVEQMGGKSTPAVGFAAGIERMIMLLAHRNFQSSNSVYLVYLDFPMDERVFAFLAALRQNGIHTKTTYQEKTLKNQLKTAAKSNCKFSLILGTNELSKGTVILRDMKTSTQEEIRLDNAVSIIKGKLVKGVILT
ncbi:MAG: histidine--tRNA ligase [bacterium]|nr:histidine--tRNA ligase [bacterium]